MTILSTKELFRIFQDSEFWRQLKRQKRAEVGACEKCGSRNRLGCYIRDFPKHWFDFTTEHLALWCRPCFEDYQDNVPLRDELKKIKGEAYWFKKRFETRGRKWEQRGNSSN